MQIIRKENAGLRLVVWAIIGQTNMAEMKALIQTIRADELCHSQFVHLIDFRAMSAEGPTPEFSELYTAARLLWREGLGARWALLASSPLVFGLLRMIHALLSESEQARIGIYRDFDDACRWLLGQTIADPASPQTGWSWSHT